MRLHGVQLCAPALLGVCLRHVWPQVIRAMERVGKRADKARLKRTLEEMMRRQAAAVGRQKRRRPPPRNEGLEVMHALLSEHLGTSDIQTCHFAVK